MNRAACVGLGLVVTGVFAYGMLAAEPKVPLVPDAKLTPGAVAVTDWRVLCEAGFNQRPRVWHAKAETLRKYGLAASMTREVEDDDLIPRCAGGDNASPLNHWPMYCAQWKGTRCVAGPAADKDVMEANACRQICERKDNGFVVAVQKWFANWRPGAAWPK